MFVCEFHHIGSDVKTYASSAIDYVTVSDLPADTTGYFRLAFNGETTLDIPITISDIGLEAILESLHPDVLNVVVTKEVESTTSSESTITWKIEYLTMLAEFKSDSDFCSITGLGLSLLAPSISSETVFDLMSITRPASKGVYPVNFTLWRTGMYRVHIYSDSDEEIVGSPFALVVSNGDITASSSVVDEDSTGSAAGVMRNLTVQTGDAKNVEYQYIFPVASLPSYINAVQKVYIPQATTFNLIFRNRQTGVITIGSTSYGDLFTELTGLGCMGTFSIESSTGTPYSAATKIQQGDTFDVTFSSLVGPMPLISSTTNAVISVATAGDAPFRAEVQVIPPCTPSGSLRHSRWSLFLFHSVVFDHFELSGSHHI